MKKLFLKLGIVAFVAVALTSCYPGGAEYTSDTDIVFTTYSDQYNFAGIQTYYLGDSINHVVDDGEDIDYSLDSFVLGELASGFEEIGYTRLDTNDINNGQEPDVAVVVTMIKTTNYNIYGGYPWYPGWGWGYYKDTQYWGYPGYGWGYYPYYPTYVTSYETGTVQWQMFDPKNVDEENEIIYVEWTGALNGVVGSSKSNTKDRITKGVNQAFTQSPYLSGN